MYTIDVPRDGYVTEKVREVGGDQVTLGIVSTCCHETQIEGSRILLMLSSGPMEMAPPGVPTLVISDQDVVWCTGASELEWIPRPPDWESTPDIEGWWVRKCSVPLHDIILM